MNFKKTLLLCKLPFRLAEEGTLKNKNKKLKIKVEERKKAIHLPCTRSDRTSFIL